MTPFDYSFAPSRGAARAECIQQAREVVQCVATGSYTAPSGKLVAIDAAVRRAVAGTIEHRPEEPIALPASGSATTTFRVVNGTSLASARALAARGGVPLVLNFASGKNPGGGFLNGARAQEESLARSSALYACIEGRAMYAHHRSRGDALYSSWMIWSPDVPVFRDDESGDLLEEPYPCAFLTAPAPNAGVVLARSPERAAEVERVMRERVTRSLAIAAAHGHRELVLGAWGCGVFGNDPAIVADAYLRELNGSFSGVFDEVTFAIVDGSDERRFIRPFAERFC